MSIQVTCQHKVYITTIKREIFSPTVLIFTSSISLLSSSGFLFLGFWMPRDFASKS